MQKIVYISNSRDFTEQRNINENLYLTHINKLLEEGWTVATTLPPVALEPDPKLEGYLHKETAVTFVVLEKPE